VDWGRCEGGEQQHEAGGSFRGAGRRVRLSCAACAAACNTPPRNNGAKKTRSRGAGRAWQQRVPERRGSRERCGGGELHRREVTDDERGGRSGEQAQRVGPETTSQQQAAPLNVGRCWRERGRGLGRSSPGANVISKGSKNDVVVSEVCGSQQSVRGGRQRAVSAASTFVDSGDTPRCPSKKVTSKTWRGQRTRRERRRERRRGDTNRTRRQRRGDGRRRPREKKDDDQRRRRRR